MSCTMASSPTLRLWLGLPRPPHPAPLQLPLFLPPHAYAFLQRQPRVYDHEEGRAGMEGAKDLRAWEQQAPTTRVDPVMSTLLALRHHRHLPR